MQGYGYGPPSMRQEVPVFAAGGVHVTSARFVCWNQTYPLGGITSVSSFAIPSNTTGPTLWLIFSIFWALAWGAGAVGAEEKGGPIFMSLISVGIAVACFFWLRSRKPSYGVMITTAGMNVRAVVSPDAQFVQAIVVALNQALAMR